MCNSYIERIGTKREMNKEKVQKKSKRKVYRYTESVYLNFTVYVFFLYFFYLFKMHELDEYVDISR